MKNKNMSTEQDNVLVFPEAAVQQDSEMDMDYYCEDDFGVDDCGDDIYDEDSMLEDLAWGDAFNHLIIEWGVSAAKVYDAISDAFELRMSHFKLPSFTSVLCGKHGCSIMGCLQENNMIFTIETNRKISARMESNLHSDISAALTQNNNDIQIFITKTRAYDNTVVMDFIYLPDDESIENHITNPTGYGMFTYEHMEERLAKIEKDIIDRKIKPILP